jgi:hypothetical protein
MSNILKLFSIEATFPLLRGLMYDGYVCSELFKFEQQMKAGHA